MSVAATHDGLRLLLFITTTTTTSVSDQSVYHTPTIQPRPLRLAITTASVSPAGTATCVTSVVTILPRATIYTTLDTTVDVITDAVDILVSNRR